MLVPRLSNTWLMAGGGRSETSIVTKERLLFAGGGPGESGNGAPSEELAGGMMVVFPGGIAIQIALPLRSVRAPPERPDSVGQSAYAGVGGPRYGR